MSGGSSSRDTGKAASANFDSSQVDAFGKTELGSRYTPESLAMLKSATTYAGGTRYAAGQPSLRGNSATNDITQMAQEYTAWISQQAAQDSFHRQYQSLASSQQGRDATILTGPAVNPNLNQSALGSLATPKPGGYR